MVAITIYPRRGC